MKASRPQTDPRDPRKFPQDSINVIKSAVAEEFSVDVSEFFREKRGRSRVSDARQVAMYLCTVFIDDSLGYIGDRFNRDHGTVMHARDRARNALKDPRVDPKFYQALVMCRCRVEALKRFAPIDLTKPASPPTSKKPNEPTGDRPSATITPFPMAG